MKHNVTVNLLIEGDIVGALRSIQTHFGEYSTIHTDLQIEVTGISLYKEHDFEDEAKAAPRTTSLSQMTSDAPQPSLDEDTNDGTEEEA